MDILEAHSRSAQQPLGLETLTGFAMHDSTGTCTLSGFVQQALSGLNSGEKEPEYRERERLARQQLATLHSSI